MKKSLDTTAIANELRGSSHFFGESTDKREQTVSVAESQKKGQPISDSGDKSIRPSTDKSTGQSTMESTNQSAARSTGQLTRRSDEQSTDQSTNESTSQSTNEPTTVSTGETTEPPYDESPILGKPKAFYITHQQHIDLDLAVAKMVAKGGNGMNQKVDRSCVLRLLLEETDLTNDRTIERLYSRHVDRMVHQLATRRNG